MSFCVGCGEAFVQQELVDGDWCEACWEAEPRVKCKRPLKHRPKMEGVLHCKTCAREQGEADDC
jgi:hypothetical protein